MARITNLEDLLAEKYRLEATVHVQKEIIREEIARLRRKMNPLHRLMDFLGMGQGTARAVVPPVLIAGANLGIDMMGYKLLARAGWIARFAIPFLAKRISSTFMDRFRKKKSPSQQI